MFVCSEFEILYANWKQLTYIKIVIILMTAFYTLTFSVHLSKHFSHFLKFIRQSFFSWFGYDLYYWTDSKIYLLHDWIIWFLFLIFLQCSSFRELRSPQNCAKLFLLCILYRHIARLTIDQHFLCERTHVTWRGKKFACVPPRAANILRKLSKSHRIDIRRVFASANCPALVELCMIDGYQIVSPRV